MNADWLNEFTKEELIIWIRQEARFIVNAPKKSKLLFIRWEMKSREMQKKRELELQKLQSFDAKARDALVFKLNAETDIRKKLEILRQIKPYDDQIKKHFDFGKKLDKEDKEIDKIYAEMELQRSRE